jgi:hypothetical protein
MNLTDLLRRGSSGRPAFIKSAPHGGTDVLDLHASAERTSLPPVEVRLPDAERVRALARHSQAESIVFQSVALGALQLIGRVLQSERQLAAAALSLAQRQKVEQMIASLEAMHEVLKQTLSRQGSKAFTPVPQLSRDQKPETSWWYSLTDAMHVLEEGTGWISMVVAGQPKGSAARLLSSVVARLLHNHYNTLLAEANQWME